METINTRPLFTMRITGSIRKSLGTTSFGVRDYVAVIEASIDGPDLKARLVSGGDDWIDVAPDGARMLNCRLMYETDDGALIGMNYRGLRHAPAAVLAREARGEDVDPQSIYHRVAIFFETSAARYAHLNRMLAIGRGHRGKTGAVYEVCEVL